MHSEDPPENNTKTIVFMEPTKKQRTSKRGNPHPPPKHEKSKRVVTTTKLWNFSDYELCHEYQKEVLAKMKHENIPLAISSTPSPTSTPILQIPPHPDPHSHIIKFTKLLYLPAGIKYCLSFSGTSSSYNFEKTCSLVLSSIAIK